MAIVTRRYRWAGGDLPAIQKNADPGATLPALGYAVHRDVTFNDSIADAIVVDQQMILLGFVFEAASPTGTPLIDITDSMRVIERVGDPTAEADTSLVYAKDVGGITQLFTRASNGTVTQLTPLASPALVWGNDTILAAADTRFMTPGRGVSASLTNIAQYAAPRAGRIRNLYARHNTATGNGNTVVYTMLVNGVASALTATLASGAVGTASDLVNVATVAQGDLLSMRAVKALALGNGGLDIQVTVEFAA